MACKISIIGAGSAIFSLNLIKDICINENLKDCSVSLMDVNEEKLEVIYNLCTRYIEEMDANITVSKTMDRRESLQGADFVLNVALDFGHERYKQGIKVAYDHGYRFGGSLHVLHDEAFFINFHQLRLMESILCDVLEICPEAYYIMVANPVQAGVTYLQRKYKNAKIIGMCHGYNGVYHIADIMGLEREHVSFEVSGVNHFIWLTSFRYKGEDAYPILDKWLEEHYEDTCKNLGESHEFGPKGVDLYRRYGLFPIGDTANPGGGAWGWEYHTDGETEKAFIENPYNWYQIYFGVCEKTIADIKKVVDDRSIKVSEALQSAVREVKSSREMGEKYMTFEEYLYEEREDAREEGRAEGLAEGRAEGREEGRAEGLADIVRKKLDKGDTPEKIAENLVEDPTVIKKIIEELNR